MTTNLLPFTSLDVLAKQIERVTEENQLLRFAAETNKSTVEAQAREMTLLRAFLYEANHQLCVLREGRAAEDGIVTEGTVGRFAWLLRHHDDAVIVDSCGSFYRLVTVFETGTPGLYLRLASEYVQGLARAHWFCFRCDRLECSEVHE